jgi:hypothetical protein
LSPIASPPGWRLDLFPQDIEIRRFQKAEVPNVNYHRLKSSTLRHRESKYQEAQKRATDEAALFLDTRAPILEGIIIAHQRRNTTILQ